MKNAMSDDDAHSLFLQDMCQIIGFIFKRLMRAIAGVGLIECGRYQKKMHASEFDFLLQD